MREIKNRLNQIFVFPKFQFVDEQRQYNGKWKIHDNIEERKHQCISEYLKKLRIHKEPLKVFQPNKFTAKPSQHRIIILKCSNQSKHRTILKNQKIQQPRQQHQIKQPVFPETDHHLRHPTGIISGDNCRLLLFLSTHIQHILSLSSLSELYRSSSPSTISNMSNSIVKNTYLFTHCTFIKSNPLFTLLNVCLFRFIFCNFFVHPAQISKEVSYLVQQILKDKK